ncbi:MAG: hypothetical protein H7X85_07605 [Thermoanaerobaculia bacterium]|nr:hypothetical protein [Thermoanaerobaculia bacterium]
MKGRAAVVAVCAAAVAARAWLAFVAPPSVDLESYGIVADIVRSGAPLYESTHRYNYSPVWSWMLRGLNGVARSTGLSLSETVRSALLLSDLATAVLLFRIAGRRRGVAPWTAAALFLANPVGIWVSSVQGQFDGLSLFFLLAAIAVSSPIPDGAKRNHALFPALLLAVSMMIKQVTALHPILWMRRKSAALAMLGAYLLVALLFLPYAAQWRAIARHVLLYRAVPRSYGLSELVLWDARWALPVSILALAAAAIAAWRLRFADYARGSLVVFLVLLFFAPGLGAQYLIWPLTVGALFAGAGYFAFTAAGTLWILGSHFGLPGSGRYMGHLVWLSVGFWLLREARALSRATLREPAEAQPAPPGASPLTQGSLAK